MRSIAGLKRDIDKNSPKKLEIVASAQPKLTRHATVIADARAYGCSKQNILVDIYTCFELIHIYIFGPNIYILF